MTDIDISGPLFDSRAKLYSTRLCEEIEKEVASSARAEVHHNLNRMIRHATPYYETQIEQHASAGGQIVTDSGVIYGPWLEDGGSRRRWFKGYGSFSKAAAKTRRDLARLVAPAVRRYLERMQ